MEKNRVPTRAPDGGFSDPGSKLSELTEGLRALISAAQTGDWERVTAISARLGPAFETARSVQPDDHNATGLRQEMEEALELLQHALQICSTRQEQIEPLISALDKISEESAGQ